MRFLRREECRGKMYNGELSPRHVIQRTCDDIGIGYLSVTGRNRTRGKNGQELMTARVLIASRLKRDGFTVQEISKAMKKNYHVVKYYLNTTERWRS
jgi:hypothetical protein